MNRADQAKWLENHKRLALFATAIFLLPLYLLFKQLSWQILFFSINIALLGICHGSIDHLKFCLKNGRLSPKRFAAFAIAYLVLAGLVLHAWCNDPVSMLIAFLSISCIHFALSEANEMTMFEKIVWGSMPVISPCFLHRNDVICLFSALTGHQVDFTTQFAVALQVLGFLLLGLAALSLVIGSLSALEEGNPTKLMNQAANLTLLVGYVLLPPLLSFTLYFCWWHSARECIRLISNLTTVNFADGFLQFTKSAAPLTIASWVLGMFIFRSINHPGAMVSQQQITSIFFLLSSLTVPHMFVSMIFANSKLTDSKCISGNSQLRLPTRWTRNESY
jgi:Brp/Blh family beta-carotene 15,15'-monooxygenase